MAPQWRRWLEYAKAKLDSTIADGEADLDRREAELEARAAGKPWLADDAEAPTLDQTRARIEHQAREAERARSERSADPVESRGRAVGQRIDSESPSDTPDSTDSRGPRPSDHDSRERIDGESPSDAPRSGPPTSGTGLTIDFEAQQREAERRVAAMRVELGLGAPADATDASDDSGTDDTGTDDTDDTEAADPDDDPRGSGST